MTNQPTTPSQNWISTRTHEPTDLEPWHAAAFAAGLALFLVAVVFGSLWLFHYFSDSYLATHRPFPVNDLQTLPEPRLQIDPREDLNQLRRANQETLENYGWVDRESKTVRIPIERAMEIIAEQGLPDFAARGLK